MFLTCGYRSNDNETKQFKGFYITKVPNNSYLILFKIIHLRGSVNKKLWTRNFQLYLLFH